MPASMSGPGPAGMDTAFVAELGDGSAGRRHLRRVRRPARCGPCLRPQPHRRHRRRGRHGAGPGAPSELGLTVRVLGTPAEEGGGGKITMLEAGVFDGVHAAMMVHPWPSNWLAGTCLAVSHFDVTFHRPRRPRLGSRRPRASTPAMPWSIAQVAIGLLRQQLPPGDQVHGVVTDGGQAANIIPDLVTGRFMCRSRTFAGLEALEPRVMACFEAGALASGASFERRGSCPRLLAHGEPCRPAGPLPGQRRAAGPDLR